MILDNMINRKIILKPLTIKILMMLSLCYLLFPQILFEVIAFRPLFAVVVLCISIIIVFFSGKRLPQFDYTVEIPVYVLIVSEALIIFVFIISGMGGIAGAQTSDYIRSNAVLADLVNNKWPVVYNEDNNISVLNYYIAYFVPGAAIGKLFGHSFHAAEIATLIWSIIGMSLGVLLIYILTGVCKLKTLWLLFCWSGLDCIGHIIVDGSLFYGTQHLEHWASIEKDYANGHIANYLSIASNLNWNPQHFIPALILVGFILPLVKSHNYKLSILTSTALLFWSPLVAMGVIPFAIVLVIYEKGKIAKFLSISDVLGLVFFGVPMCLYYLSINLSSTSGRSSIIRGPEWLADHWTILLLFIALEFGFAAYILFRSMTNDSFLNKVFCITAVVWMILCLFIDYGACHDFSMRATVISWLVLFTFSPKLLNSDDKKYRKYLLYYMIGASITSSTEYVRMLAGVGQNGFHVVRAENINNTISGWWWEYQYVGLPNSFFFSQLCNLNYDENSYKENLLASGKNYQIYEDVLWTIYGYQNSLYIYNETGSDINATIKIIGGSSDGTETLYTAGNSYAFGTLSEINGLIKATIKDKDFDKIQVTLNNGKEPVNLIWSNNEFFAIMDKTFSNEVVAADFNDDNWKAGISAGDPSLVLFEYSDANYAALHSADRILLGDNEYHVVSFDYDSNWIHIHVDKNATVCGYPSILTVE
ncbi:MAG: hypothetical protein IJ567_09420 [Lachnospiraceae bacterium]|nr:hypothetical protein [Lachnospiraceae bacterium]